MKHRVEAWHRVQRNISAPSDWCRRAYVWCGIGYGLGPEQALASLVKIAHELGGNRRRRDQTLWPYWVICGNGAHG